MTRVIVELSLILILMVHGVLGAQFTISAPTGSSTTVQCENNEELKKCWCNYNSEKCLNCNGVKMSMVHLEINTNSSEKYVTFTGLQTSTSGWYGCYSTTKFDSTATRRYRIIVSRGKDPTVVIGTLGRPTRLTCGTGQDVLAASRQWCRLHQSGVCDKKIITRGNFKTYTTQNEFILENENLTPEIQGSYKCTLDFQNQNLTMDHVVDLQVVKSNINLTIQQVHVLPKEGEKFELSCLYPEEFKYNFSKSWKCDNRDCPDVVHSTDDQFKSALLLSIDHITCTKIRSFQCVMTSLTTSKQSEPFRHSVKIDDTTAMHFGNNRFQMAMVYAYTSLNFICSKPLDYDFGRFGFGSRYSSFTEKRLDVTICKMNQGHCNKVNMVDHTHMVEYTLCVTPEENGTVYRCYGGYHIYQINIFIKVRPPPDKYNAGYPGPSYNSSLAIVVSVTVITMSMLTLALVLNSCSRRDLRRWYRSLFRRSAPLSAVDVDANMYANAIAQYYSQQRNATSPAIEDIEETSSSSDDEFEEIPVLQKKDDKDKNEYTMVKVAEPRGERGQDAAERDEEEEITYTHVVIQPKDDQHK